LRENLIRETSVGWHRRPHRLNAAVAAAAAAGGESSFLKINSSSSRANMAGTPTRVYGRLRRYARRAGVRCAFHRWHGVDMKW